MELADLHDLKRGDCISVSWVDISTIGEWMDIEDAEKESPILVLSRGFFVSLGDFQGKECLIMAGTMHSSMEQVSEITVIPVAVIDGIKREN